MSKKQFIVLPNNVVWDNQLDEVVCRCILEGIGDAENVCQRLNELLKEKKYFERKKEYFLNKWSIVHTKNIQLRQENRELKKENDNCKKDYRELFSNYVALEEENEQLKFENETLKSNYQKEIQSSIDFCNAYSKTNGELLEEIDKLKKENKELKDWKKRMINSKI